jgi:C4-type Zn-finger protein
VCTLPPMNNEPLYRDPCPLCHTPLRIEYGGTRPSAQLPYPARVWITAYRCAGCEAVRYEQFKEVIKDRYDIE